MDVLIGSYLSKNLLLKDDKFLLKNKIRRQGYIEYKRKNLPSPVSLMNNGICFNEKKFRYEHPQWLPIECYSKSIIDEYLEKIYKGDFSFLNKDILNIVYHDTILYNPYGTLLQFTKDIKQEHIPNLLKRLEEIFQVYFYLATDFGEDYYLIYTPNKIFDHKDCLSEELSYKFIHSEFSYLTVYKILHFDAAHFLEDYDGKCSNMHGGRWYIHIGIRGIIQPETDMVIDYTLLKSILKREIIDKFDHKCLNQIEKLRYNSTTENILEYIWETLSPLFQNRFDTTRLEEVIVYETPTSYTKRNYTEILFENALRNLADYIDLLTEKGV